jgi:dihydrofolate reductase
MVDLIVAVNQINGIGLGDKIPWVCKEDLKLFAEITKDSILIVGRKTAETLPKLKNRIVYCVSNKGFLKKDENNCAIFNSIHSAILHAKQESKKIFIAGGSQIYQMILLTMPTMINKIYISRIQNNLPCDKFFPSIGYITGWMIEKRTIYQDFIQEIWKRGIHPEHQYLNLLNFIKC